MKKVYIPVIIIVFGVCAFFGFQAASKILTDRQVPIEQTAAGGNPLVVQQNFVFIHVDDLSMDKPQLISIWVGFINQSSPPQFMVLPLYPANNTEVHDRITKGFSLDPDKNKLKPRFITQLESSYDIKINGYILSDDTGVSYSNKLISGVETPLASIPVVTDIDKKALILSEKKSWEQFCNLVNLGTANSYFSTINWSVLLPDHFSTNLEFERLTLLTDLIVHATGKAQCEVFSNE